MCLRLSSSFCFFDNFVFFFCKLLAYVKKNHEYCVRFVRSVAAYLRIVIACVQYRTFAVCFCET